MTVPMQIALTATPLVAYFYVLGVFHSGRRPKLVSGPVDVGLLAIGLGGLVTFGPFGRAVLGRLVGVPIGSLAWTLWVAAVVVWALVLAASASLRVTVYHASREEIDRAVSEALGQLGGNFTPTLNGYEDAKRGSGITVKPLSRLRSGAIEAYGREPDSLMGQLRPKLREALAQMPQRPSRISHAMFGLACLTMLVPVTGFFLANPRAKDALLRTLMQTLRWW